MESYFPVAPSETPKSIKSSIGCFLEFNYHIATNLPFLLGGVKQNNSPVYSSIWLRSNFVY